LASEIDDANLVKRMEVHGHLLKLCAEMDEDGSGELTKKELHEGYKKNKEFQHTLAEMQIGEDDLEILWTILDEDRSGSVCHQEFVSHCYRMKLSDTQFMLAYIKYYITVIKDKICEDLEMMKKSIAEGQEKIEQEVEKVEQEELKMEAGIERVEEEEANVMTGIMNIEEHIVQMSQSSGQRVTQEAKSTTRPLKCNINGNNEIVATQGDAIEPQFVYDGLEECRQLLADLCGSTLEIKSRLDVCIPAAMLEPKLLDTSLLALPRPPRAPVTPVTPVPKERCPVVCCQGSPPPAIVQIATDSDWSARDHQTFPVNDRGHQTFPVNDRSGSKHVKPY